MRNVSLEEVLPEYREAGVEFRRIELREEEGFPLALVWYSDEGGERGARIDLQKQIFLDDFGARDRSDFRFAAQQIVLFLHRQLRPAMWQAN